MARAIGVGSAATWPAVVLALVALVACGGGSLGSDGGRGGGAGGGAVGTGGQDAGLAGAGAAGTPGAAGAGGAAGTSGGAGITGTFSCGPSQKCTLGSDYCAIQEPSTSTQTAEYGCEPLPAGCAGATDCACLCPSGGASCPRFPFALTYLCVCGGSSGALTVDCNGE
jgi:pilus assembly protein FimV